MSKYNHEEIEKKYQAKWAEEQAHAYKADLNKKDFIIDTPPPTVSGSLHIGHIFSYTQTDIIARFKRMRDFSVFYPMGWDDNGLPTEKRVQNLYGVQCNPQKDYDPHLKIEKIESQPKQMIYQEISRKNFMDLCHFQVLEDEKKYKELWNHIGLSVDWNQSYKTIGDKAQKLSQLSFTDLYYKNYVENKLSPVLWDTQFQTAVAQADVEDRLQNTFYNNIAFQTKNGEEFVISTTRPELLPACVAVVAHPSDERYKKLFGKYALTPLFKRLVPILASNHADPEKGTGILMVCTFGDMEDVSFVGKKQLSILQIINDQGFLMDIDFFKGDFKSENPEQAKQNYSHLKNLRVRQARKKIIELLKEKSFLRGEPQPAKHHVKFYEKGDFPLEILPKRQWYINVLDHKNELLKQADKIHWHPPNMKKRYEQWVEGLNQNWCISRQRVYGVPFPVWYPLDSKGQVDYKQAIIPKDLNSAVDPIKDKPPGSFNEKDRDKLWIAETDVMDTWATSSLTPFINSDWNLDKTKHKKFFPADLRPQAHEIIRTWAFYSIVKAYFHEKKIPWKHIAISGWVVTPDRSKMSKSKGNALTPENLIKVYSADAVRYWSAKARLGQDTLYDENLFKIGKRLVTKIFNASRFVHIQVGESPFADWRSSFQEITSPIDQAWVKELIQTKIYARDCLENYKHATALERIEKTFWSFCDNYLELVKSRVYQLKDQKEGVSGKRALDYSLYTFLKLFAPYLPYVTEEIWQSCYLRESSSVHKTLQEDLGDSYWKNSKGFLFANFFKRKGIKLENAFFILDEIRSKKSQHNKSLASPLKKLELSGSTTHLKEFNFYKEDIAKASHVDLENIVTLHKADLKKPAIKVIFEDGTIA